MIRGTSQPFKFTSPYDIDDIVEIRIWFGQYGNDGTPSVTLPIIKTIDDCTFNTNTKEIFVTLDQTETFAFTDNKKAYMQFRAILSNGYVFGSKPIQITVYPALDETIIS